LSAIGAVIGFVGVVVMLSPGGERIEPLGVAAALTAMVSSSVGFVLARRWGGASDVPLLASTAWQVLIGGLLLLPVAGALEGAPPALDTPALLAFAYLSVVCTALAYVAWFSGLARLPAAVVGVVGLLNPVTGVLLGILVAGEAFGPGQVLGIVLVLVGVVVGTLLEGVIRKRVSPSAPDGTPETSRDSSVTESDRTAS
jgi:probable blue pigment (indigoidine) exporter